ncbi:MAG: hypothetical protein GC201_18390 [Alphaproteobacteria bacterium]|nr:hypothetical protein [Alphaproteobacteria bacterium]
MIKRIPEIAGLPALVLAMTLFHAAPAAAFDLDFCTGSKNCTKVTVPNEAAVTVIRVNVRQLGDSTNDCAEVEKSYKKNTGTWDKFNIGINYKCSYHFKFNTTKGCVGSKDKVLSSTDLGEGIRYVALSGTCGLLKVKTGMNLEDVSS